MKVQMEEEDDSSEPSKALGDCFATTIQERAEHLG